MEVGREEGELFCLGFLETVSLSHTTQGLSILPQPPQCLNYKCVSP